MEKHGGAVGHMPRNFFVVLWCGGTIQCNHAWPITVTAI